MGQCLHKLLGFDLTRAQVLVNRHPMKTITSLNKCYTNELCAQPIYTRLFSPYTVLQYIQFSSKQSFKIYEAEFLLTLGRSKDRSAFLKYNLGEHLREVSANTAR